jgi:hypothetical protein
MTENHNEMFFEHLKQAWEHLQELPWWRWMLYMALFVFTNGYILLALTCYWAIKRIIFCIKEMKRLNKEIKELEKELEELEKSERNV